MKSECPHDMVPILGWVVGVKKHRMDTTRQELFFLTGGHQLFLWFEQVEENSGTNQESIDYHKTILKKNSNGSYGSFGKCFGACL